MANENMPECVHCFGKNWTQIAEIVGGDRVITTFWQCGHGPAGSEREDMKSGCGRVITASPERMNAGGVI